ncbi:MAG: hypothetical protein H7062_11740 [Candidatus Saccharimonas sp.]|nr:hypothetical protein [Planctomycetaceae bacterium]
MERLEPVLKQKFWILLGIGILMTIVGWWMATGTMAATITTRTSEIKAAEGKVPSGEIPNNGWSEGLSAVNVQQDLAVKSATGVLWQRQRARMTWPETVAEFAWKTGYRKEIALPGRENYKRDYEYDWRRVWEVVQPFNRIDGTGIVDFSPSKLPRQQWGSLAPSSDEMWDAQEDLWLLEGILQSIADVNGGVNSTRLDACVHVIEKLTLHGGQPAGQRTLATPGGAGGGASSGAEMMSSSFGGGNFGSGGGGGGSTAVSADFDVKEEFGDDGGGAGGQQLAMASSMAATGLGGPGAAAVRAKRYIDDEASLPFKTRGFYMTLIMDHRKIPNLISELSASEKSAWPIEIVRVQYVRLHEDDTGSGGAVGGYNPSMAGGESFGSPGVTGESSFGAAAAPVLSIDGNAGVAGGPTSKSQVEMGALMNALQDPNMARVAICGIITLYKEVTPEATTATPAGASPVSPEPTTDTAATPSTQSPDGTTPVSEADAAAESKTPASTDGKPATPDGNPSPTPEATPKKNETPPTPPETKPADTP